MKEAIILAGGFGTRLKYVVSDVPKPMAPVCGRPFLEHLLDYLIRQDFRHVVLSTGYMHEKIEQHFGSCYKTLLLDYAFEAQPLGTGGGIMNALLHCDEQTVVVLNGDTMFRVNFNELTACYQQHETLLTIVLRQVSDTGRYGSVQVDNTGRITAFVEKAAAQGAGLINGGIYMLNRTLFDLCDFHYSQQDTSGNSLPPCFSFEKDLMERQLHNLPFYGVLSNGYFIDIGVPEDYYRAQNELK